MNGARERVEEMMVITDGEQNLLEGKTELNQMQSKELLTLLKKKAETSLMFSGLIWFRLV